MIHWILIVVGTIVFGIGLYGWITKKDDPSWKKRFGWISYFGVGFLYLGIILSLEPILSQLPSVLLTVLTAVVFFFSAIIFLPFKKK